MSPERRRQATLPVQRRHNHDQDGPFPLVEAHRGPSAHARPQKQRSQSLPRNRDVRIKGRVKPSGITEEKSEEKLPIKKQSSLCEEGKRKQERLQEVKREPCLQRSRFFVKMFGFFAPASLVNMCLGVPMQSRHLVLHPHAHTPTYLLLQSSNSEEH